MKLRTALALAFLLFVLAPTAQAGNMASGSIRVQVRVVQVVATRPASPPAETAEEQPGGGVEFHLEAPPPPAPVIVRKIALPPDGGNLEVRGSGQADEGELRTTVYLPE